MGTQRKFSVSLVFFSALVLAFKLCTINNPFFWDTVQLSSKQAHFYFENNFTGFLLPDNIDSGHPPTFGIVLALLWKAFGRNLMVGHVFMSIFLIGIVYQLKKLFEYLLPGHVFLALLLVLSDATFLAQSSLVSPDILVLFFFMLCLNAILFKNYWLIFISIIGLGLVSTRGAMSGIALFCFAFYPSGLKNWKQLLLFLPGFLIVAMYQMAHFYFKGWILYHSDSPWTESFIKTDLQGFVKNVGILGWRLLDNGRVFTILLFTTLVYRNRKTILKNQLIYLLAFAGIFSVFPLLLYVNLIGHRYLMPFIFIINILVLTYLFQAKWSLKTKYVLVLLSVFCSLSGNFWVYPDFIAKGWDASLAYYPINNLATEMESKFKKYGLVKPQITTAFPLYNASYFTHLDTDKSQYKTFTKLKNEPWILYSNIENGFSNLQLDSLKNYYRPIETLEKGQLKLILYQLKL